MSWDFHMSAPVGEDGKLVDVGYRDLNYTYNVSPMYYRAFGDEGIRVLHGKTGTEAAPLIVEAAAKMRANPSEYRALNPENGWGDYDGALRVLDTLLEWCRELPGAQVRIS